MEVELKALRVPNDWTIKWNNFVNIEPDNNYPIDDVWTYFEEDTSYFVKGAYFIDLGFYGDYLKDKSGFFRLYVANGNFTQGILFESFISRSTDEIKIKIEYYLELISSGEIGNLKGLKYNEGCNIGDYIFSAKDSVKIRLTDTLLEQYCKSKL